MGSNYFTKLLNFRVMKKLLLYLLLLQLLILPAIRPAFAQNDVPAPTLAFTIPHDPSFGFYPIVTGSFGLKPNLSFTFYGIFWTNPGFANAFPAGTDWFLEAGAGVSFLPAEGLLVNPSIGFTHGKLLSGGAEGVIADGMVPNLALFYNKGRLESELYAAYYKALRKEGPVTTDYFLGWIFAGAVLHQYVSAGVHYEQFDITRMTQVEAKNLYRWLGPYVKFTLPKGYYFRFSAGANFTRHEGFSSEFYRLGLFLPVM